MAAYASDTSLTVNTFARFNSGSVPIKNLTIAFMYYLNLLTDSKGQYT
jgi:hypothetical protein